MYDVDFFARCLERVQAAVAEALPRRTPITHISHGAARVINVASNRRVDRDEVGVVREMRLSSCTDPRLTGLPEGTIDPQLQTLAFHAPDGRRVVACHFYATHPMSFYRDGRVTSDFCGLARKRVQAEEPTCTHLYFTGCAGNISAGKFNDGSPAARVALTERMYQGMLAAGANSRLQPLTSMDWRTDAVLPAPRLRPTALELEAAISDPHRPLVERLLPAYRLGWLRRFTQGTPLVLSRLRLNDLSVLHLPGEMFIEYQLRAQALRPGQPVLIAAYGDDGIWYVPTREEYSKGGYEVGVAFCTEEIDETITNAMQRLLA